MGTLNEYLTEKGEALDQMMVEAMANPQVLDRSASVEVRGRSGVRAIKIRQFELISDTGLNLAGFDLGPTSPEHQLAALGGCIAHTVLMVAANMKLSVESVSVDVHAQMHPLAQTPGYEDVPRVPHNLRYTLNIGSLEPTDRLQALHEQVVAICPVYNLIREPQPISGELIVRVPD